MLSFIIYTGNVNGALQIDFTGKKKYGQIVRRCNVLYLIVF